MGELITKDNFEKLQQKLEELKKRRVKISKTIGEAREHGDLRENSAYHSANWKRGSPTRRSLRRTSFQKGMG